MNSIDMLDYFIKVISDLFIKKHDLEEEISKLKIENGEYYKILEKMGYFK